MFAVADLRVAFQGILRMGVGIRDEKRVLNESKSEEEKLPLI